MERNETLRSQDWSWTDAPILLPLAFERREMNAVFIALYMAECSGSQVRVVHVKVQSEDRERIEDFIKELKGFASDLRVSLSIEIVDLGAITPSLAKIAETLVSKAEEHDVQAVVMAAHKEPYFRELFGRVSDRVAKSSMRKVILVETPRPGLNLQKNPSRLVIPVLRDIKDPEPFILAAALTSSASSPKVELVALKVVELPPTTPMDAVDTIDFKKEERNFSTEISTYIKNLGRLFQPRIIVVREVGKDLGEYVEELGADLMILSAKKRRTLGGLLTSDEYSVVRRAPCVCLVAFSKWVKRS